MAYYSRSSWTNVKKSAVKLAGTGRTQEYIYIHYPGQPGNIGRANTSVTKRRLKGYLRQHTRVNGWADIAYNVAVDQSGNVWELRGIDRQSGANGGTTSNRHGQAILVLVGNNEKPTPECIAGIKDAISRIQKVHSKANTLRGHQQSPDASTACPGPHLMELLKSGGLKGSAPAKKQPAAKKADGSLVEDGRFGKATVKVLQKFLNSQGEKLKVDGKAGFATWMAMQRYLKAPYQDGKISRQSYKAEELGDGITQGWEYTGRKSSGSQTVELLQKWVGVKADGVWFEGTTKALQRKLNAVM